jgi:hypothetical protein
MTQFGADLPKLKPIFAKVNRPNYRFHGFSRNA